MNDKKSTDKKPADIKAALEKFSKLLDAKMQTYMNACVIPAIMRWLIRKTRR